jgi:CheY-like chemotaxis protein
MLALDVNELAEKLVLLQLVPQAEVDGCMAILPGARRTAPGLLDCLEAKGALTSYQITRIRKGEIQGLILGPYKLLYRNASGSFARVFRACRLSDGTMVGLKILRQRWAADPQMVATFHREAELGKSLQHENIVPIYDVEQVGDQHFFTMEFVEGGNLRDFVSIRGKLSPLEATKCLMEMAQGLSYAAGKGIQHRDLKLTNVLMSSQGMARLVDFGLATAPSLNGLEDDEAFQRALDYATLEKGTGVPRDDSRSDLYFLGTVYYELLTGQPPLARTRSRNERGRFGRYEDVIPLERVDPDLPSSVIRLCNRMMELSPVRRYQNPSEVLFDSREAYIALGGKLNGSRVDTGNASITKTVMFIENRVRHQDLLREYFSKHGYRVLMMGDIQRGVNRLAVNPPDCVIIMAEGIGDTAMKGFRMAQQIEAALPALRILILAERQADWKQKIHSTDNSRILVQPLHLRKLRHLIESAIGRPTTAPKADETSEDTDGAVTENV